MLEAESPYHDHVRDLVAKLLNYVGTFTKFINTVLVKTSAPDSEKRADVLLRYSIRSVLVNTSLKRSCIAPCSQLVVSSARFYSKLPPASTHPLKPVPRSPERPRDQYPFNVATQKNAKCPIAGHSITTLMKLLLRDA